MILADYNFKGILIEAAAFKVMHIRVGVDNSLYALVLVFSNEKKDSISREDAIDAFDIEMEYIPDGEPIFDQVYSKVQERLGV